MGCCLSCANELANMGESGNTPVTIVGSTTDRRTRSESESGKTDASTAIKPAKVFTFRELATATKYFRSQLLLGRGGFGRVYKGQLRNGQDVAVKLLDKDSQQGDKEFFAEVEMLSLVHHPNLVTLIGYCYERDQRLLVYEYMPLGSLEHHLYDLPLDREPLDWKTRMKIATGVAKGLEYLHDWADQPVIFRDFKSSNILLDEDYHPKLSDFGMAKFGPLGDSSHVSTRVVGTYGYCAPEYVITGHLTPKCDVYGFGVVLLELISGRKVIDKSRAPDMRHLVMWAQPLFKDRNQFHRLVDPLLQGCFPMQGLYQAIAVAAMCLHEDADRRPLIRDVVTALTYMESQHYDPNESSRGGPSSCAFLFPSPSAGTEFGRKETGLDDVQKKHESQRDSSSSAADTGTARETPGNPDVDTQPAVKKGVREE